MAAAAARTRFFFFGSVLFLVSMLACGWARAGSLSVNPVRVMLSDKRPVAALTLQNSGGAPALVQLEVFSWSQREGKDVYTPTREILATPPIFTVQAGGSQLLRVGLRRPIDPQRELSYRLYLQEVPPPPAPGFRGLQVALRIGVPVFVLPLVQASPMLQWKAATMAPGKIKITAANSGNVHVQVANFSVSQANSALPPVTRQVAAYLMPGQSLDWIVKANLAPGATLRLAAQTDAGNVETDLVLEKQ